MLGALPLLVHEYANPVSLIKKMPLASDNGPYSIMKTAMSKYVPHWMHYLLPVSALSIAPALTEHILTPVPILPDQHLNGSSLIKWGYN